MSSTTDFKIAKLGRISGSHGVEYDDGCLLMIEAVRTSETSVNFYQTTRRYNPEDSHLQPNWSHY
jgi:hypothetical protein